MLKRILFAVVAVVFSAQTPAMAQAKPGKDAPPQGQVACPVMGNPVKDLPSAARSEYKGQTYYFCCPSCKEKFDKDPEKYVGKANEGHQHTCGGSSGCGHQGH